ncbi:MAG: glycosyltransferase family 2 protein [Gemmatimonadetes bacterium]|nr:glycosyltransferase family 2 protein [Gemmatimonadota bacterium]
MTPQLSVIMPVYNGAAWVRDAVASVLASPGVELELVLVDDGSTDDSVARARAQAAGDPRLVVLPVPHGGVARARNAGLHAARGALVANLDSDDTTFPERFARQVAFLAAHPDHVAVGTRALIVDGEGRPQRIWGRHFTHEAIDAAHLAAQGTALGNPTAMFRRQSALDAGGYDDALAKVGEDLDFWLRLAEHGRLANLPDVLICYRVHGSNVSIGQSSKEARAEVTQRVVGAALARRRLAAPPAAGAPPAEYAWERPVNEALLRHFRGERRAATAAALLACARFPAETAARAALRTVTAGAWPGIVRVTTTPVGAPA